MRGSKSKEEIETKKRKEVDKTEGSKSQTSGDFPPTPKVASPSALKKGKCGKTHTEETHEDSGDPTCEGSTATYLCLMLDVPPDRDHTGRCRLVLSRLFTSMKNANPETAIMLCQSTLEHSEGMIQCPRKDCIHHLHKLPRSFTQLHKYFPKGKPKRGGGTILPTASFHIMKR